MKKCLGEKSLYFFILLQNIYFLKKAAVTSIQGKIWEGGEGSLFRLAKGPAFGGLIILLVYMPLDAFPFILLIKYPFYVI